MFSFGQAVDKKINKLVDRYLPLFELPGRELGAEEEGLLRLSQVVLLLTN